MQVVAEGIGLEKYLIRNVAALSQQLQEEQKKVVKEPYEGKGLSADEVY